MYLLSMYLLGIIKRFTSSLLEVLNKHAPLKQLSRREKKLSLKPWITKGIYNSIKTKNRSFRICYKHGDFNKIAFYKTYCNKLTHLKRTSKIQYYNKLFNECNNNNSETWKLINTLITKKAKSAHKIIPDKISINEQLFKTNSNEFANVINDYFTNIGNKMAAKIPPSNVNYTDTLQQNILSSFVIDDIDDVEVMNSIHSLKTKASPGLHGISAKYF